MPEDKVQQWGCIMTPIKIIVAYMILIITSYGMIDGLIRPDHMAFVRNPGSNIDLQPDSFIMQLGSWLLAFCANIFSLIYLIFKRTVFNPSTQ
jgi:hypothetical protein